MAVHRNLTGADLHEPKGADTALAGQIYVSDGAGSGAWTTASSVITNSAWSTGDMKVSLRSAADAGWIKYLEGGTIGDGSSGASLRANADTFALYSLYWSSFSDGACPVSGGRGASAAADFAAHKTLRLLLMAGRVLGVAGNGIGLTPWGLGASFGVENITLVTNHLPAYTPTGFVSTSVTSTINDMRMATGNSPLLTSVSMGSNTSGSFGSVNSAITSSASSTFIGNPQGGTSTPFTVMQPTVFVTLFIKL